MGRCGFCNTTTFFSSHKRNGQVYCSGDCLSRDALRQVAGQLPREVIEQHVQAVHQGNCPRCGGPGPVDVHTSYKVYSLLLFTSWSSATQICCRPCGLKARLGATAFSGLCGWWGFPYGLVMTPIQVLRNLAGIVASPAPDRPSEQLRKHLSVQLGAATVQAIQAEQGQP